MTEGRSSPDPDPGVGESRQLGGLLKHSVIYSAAPLARQLISIGMHRLYTGWLAPAGMGVKEVVDFWLIALQQLLGVNALGAMVRFYYDRQDERERARVVTSCTILITLAAVVACGTAFVFSPRLAPLLLGAKELARPDELRILQLVLVLVPFQLATVSGLYYLQALKRSGLFTTIQTVKLLFEVALNFILIGALGLGVEGFLLSILAGEALTSFFLCGWIFRTLGMRIDWRLLRPILEYALPLVPVGLCQLVLHSLDRRLLIAWGSESMAGIYGHGYKIGYLVTGMLLGPFLQIWHPWVFAVHDPGERARLVARVSTYAVLTIGAASLGVIFLGRQAAILLGAYAAFWEAYRVIPFIAAGYVFWALYHVAQMPLLIAKRTGRLFLINFLAVLVNVGLNLWLIPDLGMVGAAITTLATFVFLSALCMLVSRSQLGVPFELGRLSGILLMVLVGGAFALWIDSTDDAGGIPTVLAIGAKLLAYALLGGLLWIGVLSRDERRRFAGWLAARAWR